MNECRVFHCDRLAARQGLCWRHYEHELGGPDREPRRAYNKGDLPRRRSIVKVGLTHLDRARVVEAAEYAGMSISAWIGQLIEDTLRLEDDDK